MKILHVTNAAGWSGGLEQMRVLLTGLEARAVSNILVCPPACELAPKLNGAKTKIESLSMFQDYDLPAAWKLKGLIKKERPDIVHAHHATAHAVALVALWGMARPPLVVSRRVSFSPRKNPFSRWKYGSGRIHAYSAVSRSIGETLAKNGVAPEKIHVIYGAFDQRRFYPMPADQKLKSQLRIPDGYALVGKIANAALWKGQSVLLESAKIVLRKNPRVLFVFAGKQTETLGAQARAIGIEQNLRLLGFRNDIPQILSNLNLSLNCAISGEGLSGAVRESLAMEIPVIATDVAGNGEIVQDGQTGLLVPANQPHKLAEQILYALSNPVQMKQMAQKGRQWVLENCSEQAMISHYIQLYSSLTKEATPALNPEGSA